MKKVILIISMVTMAIVGTWFFLSRTRIGVGFRVIGQMIVPPVGLFDNKVEFPIQSDMTYYEILMTNRFVGCYAVRVNVPMEVRDGEASPFDPPDIMKARQQFLIATLVA